MVLFVAADNTPTGNAEGKPKKMFFVLVFYKVLYTTAAVVEIYYPGGKAAKHSECE